MDCGAFDFFSGRWPNSGNALFDSVIWLASADARPAEISAIMALLGPMCSSIPHEKRTPHRAGAQYARDKTIPTKVHHREKAFVGIRADAARDRRGTNSGKGRNKERAAEGFTSPVRR